MEQIEPYCQAHHKDGMFRCDNLDCNKFLCCLYMQESEEFIDLLPSRISYFCFSCVNDLKMERGGTTNFHVTDPIDSEEKQISKYDICQKVIYEGKNINPGLVTHSDKRDKQPVGNQHPLSSGKNNNLKPTSTSGKISKENDGNNTIERVSPSFENNDCDKSLQHKGLLIQVNTAPEDTPDNEKGSNELSKTHLQYLNPVRRNLFPPTQEDSNSVYANSSPANIITENCIETPRQRVSTSTVPEERDNSDKGEVLTEESLKVYIPECYHERINSNDEPKIIHNNIKKRDWMLEDLNEEIKKRYPSKEEITVDNSIGEWKGDLDVFKNPLIEYF